MKSTVLLALLVLCIAGGCSQITQPVVEIGEESAALEDGGTNEDGAVADNGARTVTYSARGVTFSMTAVSGGITFPTGIDDSGRETVERSFYIGETEVTYALWSAVRNWAQNRGYQIAAGRAGSQEPAGGNKPFAVDTQEPVTSITWYDAVVWCNALTEWLNAQKGTALEPVYYYRQGGGLCKDSGNLEAFAKEDDAHQFGSPWADSAASGFRLPLSKEWELAARWQGDKTANGADGFSGPYFCRGDSASGATADYTNETATRNVAVYNAAKTARVGSKTANALGLFDMSGNVYEWCYNWSVDGEGRLRVTRGGCFRDLTAYYTQVGHAGFAAVDAQYANVGFRVVCASSE